ncbi:MAG: hypothetical protein D3913_16375, partial [Candidatus Electrothrix sp. LOE1_4_5]|nr:hypothetical protein [Candidatus Electrothrix gigas]
MLVFDESLLSLRIENFEYLQKNIFYDSIIVVYFLKLLYMLHKYLKLYFLRIIKADFGVEGGGGGGEGEFFCVEHDGTCRFNSKAGYACSAYFFRAFLVDYYFQVYFIFTSS